MDDARRRFLASVALGSAGALAGCTGNVGADVSGTVENGSPLAVDALDSWAAGSDDEYRAVLVVHGSLRNATGSPVAFPRIEATFHSPSGAELGRAEPAYLVVDGERTDAADAPAEVPADGRVEFRFVYEPDRPASAFVVSVE